MLTVKEKAEKLYKKVKVFMLSCSGADGYPLTKAVVPGKYRDSLDEMYFCTNTSSKFAGEVGNNTKACVYFYSKVIIWKGCYLKGNMEIVPDIQVKKKFWQTKFKNAYPERSASDPEFCVLKFTPLSGRFYSWFKPEDFEI